MTLDHKQAAKIAAAAWNGGHPLTVTLRMRAGCVEFRLGKEHKWHDAAPS